MNYIAEKVPQDLGVNFSNLATIKETAEILHNAKIYLCQNELDVEENAQTDKSYEILLEAVYGQESWVRKNFENLINKLGFDKKVIDIRASINSKDQAGTDLLNRSQLEELNDSFSLIFDNVRQHSTVRKDTDSNHNKSNEGSIEFKNEDSFLGRNNFNNIII